MKSALGFIVGVSVLAACVGACGGGGDDTGPGPVMVGQSGSTGSAGTGTGGGVATEGVPLDPMNGWVAGDMNSLKIQGALFPFGDPTSKVGMEPMDFKNSGAMACLKGTAAKVDMLSTPCATHTFTPPATDCYGEYWGAAIGLNLNQMIDATSGVGGTPAPYDASAIKGFSFKIAGAGVPAPSAFRFKVENSAGEYCNTGAKPLMAGDNTVMLKDLITQCWKPVAGAPTGEGARATLIKIAWQVVTNDKATVPFDFCVSNIRAIPN